MGKQDICAQGWYINLSDENDKKSIRRTFSYLYFDVLEGDKMFLVSFHVDNRAQKY
jgi:hypothetical protein